MKYETLEDDEWVRPKHRGFKFMCCDCSLVHVLDFKIEDGEVVFRARRDKKATAAARRAK